jgi:adenylate cyclase
VSETRKIAAILVADVVGYSRLAGAEEDRTLSRLRSLRGDLIDPAIAAHRGRIVKRTGDGSLVEFRSVVDAVRCAIEVQNGLVERNAGVAAERRIEFRIVGDVVEEADGDLMGDGVNIAARPEGICEPGGICLSEDAYRQVRDRVKEDFADLGYKELKNIARPVRVYAVNTEAARATVKYGAPAPEKSGPPRLSIVVLPFANLGGDVSQDYFVDGVTESLTTDLSRIAGSFVIGRNTAFTYQGQSGRSQADRGRAERSLRPRRQRPARGGNRLWVNVQLVDAESGANLWAERFDKPVTDLFDMQDEIVAQLANTLNAQAPSPMSSFRSFTARRKQASLRLPDVRSRGFSCQDPRGRFRARKPRRAGLPSRPRRSSSSAEASAARVAPADVARPRFRAALPRPPRSCHLFPL